MKQQQITLFLLILCISLALTSFKLKNVTRESKVGYEEIEGILAVEAEHFSQQTTTEKRKWYVIDRAYNNEIQPDADSAHIADASGGVYLEILPDSRTTHADKLIRGTNFTNTPGEIAVLTYKVYVNTPGKYFVWVRAYSTGSEDNGLHVGIDGQWPESGQRLQWCKDKNQWTWESKQRTVEQHCGVEKQIFLEVNEKGWHDIHFSMREDGFEFDKWVMSLAYEKPIGIGPKEKEKQLQD